ncbi:iron ABC transporter permease [Aneurinibacillus migulanus]|uniref:FecCD family ABC transporter permease n=1 Tax=Aneurinibacillus migulanus TaxID=47500 RepID=UPI0005BCB7CD|nr:iron ABC transporter permease [Aneurinibacillus migulanus]KIV51602.1 iron ABC transporter permease [Aneurinibacillus migulanus]KPD08266.1 iron ABC transporter permease [Aneurinibacillus migulanus]
MNKNILRHYKTVHLFKRQRAVISLLILLLFISFLSVGAGSLFISPLEIVKVLCGIEDNTNSLIILDIRLPRIILAILVGIALGVAGAIMQGVIRNPLVSPDLIGITGGGNVAAIAFLTMSAGQYSIHWLPFIAIIGSLLTTILIYVLAWKKGASPLRLVLIGIGISAAMSALTVYFIITGPTYMTIQAMSWLTGSVHGASWSSVLTLLPWVVVFVPPAIYWAKHLDVLQLGEEIAIGLGSNVQRTQMLLIGVSVALAGAAIGVAGGIGFIGLMAPHIARKIVGSQNICLLPATGFIGAMLLVIADIMGRMLFSPLDVPAGGFIALFGAPFFIYLLFMNRQVR